jgi:hypothetical protein
MSANPYAELLTKFPPNPANLIRVRQILAVHAKVARGEITSKQGVAALAKVQS